MAVKELSAAEEIKCREIALNYATRRYDEKNNLPTEKILERADKILAWLHK